MGTIDGIRELCTYCITRILFLFQRTRHTVVLELVVASEVDSEKKHKQVIESANYQRLTWKATQNRGYWNLQPIMY